LWTYLPAYFSNLRIWDDAPAWAAISFPELDESVMPGTVSEWFLEGYGTVTCEPGGILNLNRYLPVSVNEVRLMRQVEVLEHGNFSFHTGYSDMLRLQVDEQVIFSGVNLFKSSPNWHERGYVSADHQVSHPLARGVHSISVTLKAKEFFGFGMVLRIEGGDFRWLPADLYG
jgi:hypothetical protein